MHLFDLSPEDVATTTDDWYTPRWVFAAAAARFDMDVCAPVDPAYRACPADRYLTIIDDGLSTPWDGLVWCNPPYSKAEPWVQKWARHPDGLLLVMALPEVRWRGDVMKACHALTLLGLNFDRPDGSTARLRQPYILAARGARAVDALRRIAAADPYSDGAYLTHPKACGKALPPEATHGGRVGSVQGSRE